MKKKYKIKWKNIIIGILLLDVIRTFGVLTFNPSTSLTIFGLLVLAIEVMGLGVLYDF